MNEIALFGGILNLVAVVMYFQQMRQGRSQPNPASWLVWSFIAIMNVLSWSQISDSSFLISLQLWVNAAAVIFISLYASITGRFSRLTLHEWMMLFLGILATLVWWGLRSASGANIIIVLAYIISYIPTIEGVIANPEKEAPVPWVFWGFAFGVSGVNIILIGADTLALISPTVLALLHLSIAFLASRKIHNKAKVST